MLGMDWNALIPLINKVRDWVSLRTQQEEFSCLCDGRCGSIFIRNGPVWNNGFVFLSVVAVVFEVNRLLVDGQL